MVKPFGVLLTLVAFMAVHRLSGDLVGALLMAAVVFFVESWSRRPKRSFVSPDIGDSALSVARRATHDYQETPSYKNLVRACMGDGAAAERLIEHEMRLSPGMSRSAATVSALDRLYIDRRHHL